MRRSVRTFLTTLGADPQLRRLQPEERWAFLAGILTLANEQGRLLIADGVRVTWRDVAQQASISPRLARESMHRFRSLGLIGPDEELGCERVTDRLTGSRRPSDRPPAAARRKRNSRKRGVQEAMLE